MHEMGIVMEIVDVVSAASHGDRVARIRLEIGALSMVAPKAMRLCVDVAARGSRWKATSRPFGRCACGATDLEWLSGEELRLPAVEVS